MRRVANRQPFIRLFAELCVLTLFFQRRLRDAESSEVLGMREGEFGEGEFGEAELGRGGGIVNVVRVGRAVR